LAAATAGTLSDRGLSRNPKALASPVGPTRPGGIGQICDHRNVPAAAPLKSRSLAELTAAVLGESLTMDQLGELVGLDEMASTSTPRIGVALRVGSIGYEKYRESRDFANRLSQAGIERLIDVRELPISRRRGYAKTALGQVMAEHGIEYVHVRALGNPKPYRDLYKAGKPDEGQALYTDFLLTERRDALDDLAEMLKERRSALMCVEHNGAVCHRSVIFKALRSELGLRLDVLDLG
jgi:hypothetical protein